MMETFLSDIAWKMPVFTAGSPFHWILLCFTAGMIFFEIRMFRKIQYQQKILFPVIGWLLLFMEIVKQLLLTYVRHGDYSWSDFPYQLCSIPMYLALIYPILKERAKRTVEGFLMTFGTIGGIAALAEPVSLFTDYTVLTLHSIIWHLLLIFMGVFVLIDRIKEHRQPRWREWISEYRKVGRLYLCFALIAVFLNGVLRPVSHGTANLFFLGPSYPDMFILNGIYDHYGWIVETVLFSAVTWGIGLFVFLLFSWISSDFNIKRAVI